MAVVNVDMEQVKKLYDVCVQSLEVMKESEKEIRVAYAEAGKSWRGDRYKKLDSAAGNGLNKAEEALKQLDRCMEEFRAAVETMNGKEAAMPETNGNAEEPIATGTGRKKFIGLEKTQAGAQIMELSGHRINVYNTPYETSVKHAIEVQGTAFPTTFRGTCGLCSSGAVMNMAGFCYTERDVVLYASENGFCVKGKPNPNENGGTTPTDIEAVIEGMSGIRCVGSSGRYSLEQLAVKVEAGHGVVLSVDASGLPYQGYRSLPPHSGHAIVLASVARNSVTNAIEGYFIFDSNGRKNGRNINMYDVCQFIPKDILEACYEMWGRRSNLSEQIIR